jgi:competence protein ComEC
VKTWENIPAVKFALLFIAGILTGSNIYFNLLLTALLILLIAGLILFHLSRNISHCRINAEIFFLVFLCGILKSSADFNSGNSQKINPENFNSYVFLTGVVNDIPHIDSNGIKFVINAEQIINEDTTALDENILVRINLRNNYSGTNDFADISAGDRVQLLGRLRQPPQAMNPGEFDFRKYLTLSDINYLFNVSEISDAEIISDGNLNYFSQNILIPFKKFVINNINENNPGDGGAFLLGLVAGERSRITRDLKEDFVDAGVMHLIAVSGLNVAYVIFSLMLFFSLLRIPKTLKIILIILCLIFYSIFTGNSASILRASIMGISVLIYGLLQREKEFYNIIGASCLIILAIDSRQLFDAGFILSYISVISIIFIYERSGKKLIEKINNSDIRFKKIYNFLLLILLTSVCAQIGTIPLNIYYFERVSIIGIFTNIVLIPLSNLSLALGFIQIFLSVISSFIASFVAAANNLLLDIQIYIIKWTSGLNFSHVYIPRISIFIIAVYYFILLILITANKNNIFKKIIICLIIISGAILINTDFNKRLSVNFINVGQGECCLIQTEDDKNILIDCGPEGYNYDIAKNTIYPFLKRQGVNKIDLLIFSHLHKDHISGFQFLSDNLNIEKLAESGLPESGEERNTVDNIVISKKIVRDFLKSSDEIEVNSSLKFYILYPDKDNSGSRDIQNSEYNNYSLVFKMKYLNSEILFCGDIGKEQEEHLIYKYGNFLKSDILKVPHHGSGTSSSVPFLLYVNPEYSVINCGYNNMYKNPSQIILNRLHNINSSTFRTDEDGAVIFRYDDGKLLPYKWR